jgi:hypothetical protein
MITLEIGQAAYQTTSKGARGWFARVRRTAERDYTAHVLCYSVSDGSEILYSTRTFKNPAPAFRNASDQLGAAAGYYGRAERAAGIATFSDWTTDEPRAAAPEAPVSEAVPVLAAPPSDLSPIPAGAPPIIVPAAAAPGIVDRDGVPFDPAAEYAAYWMDVPYTCEILSVSETRPEITVRYHDLRNRFPLATIVAGSDLRRLSPDLRTAIITRQNPDGAVDPIFAPIPATEPEGPAGADGAPLDSAYVYVYRARVYRPCQDPLFIPYRVRLLAFDKSSGWVHGDYDRVPGVYYPEAIHVLPDQIARITPETAAEIDSWIAEHDPAWAAADTRYGGPAARVRMLAYWRDRQAEANRQDARYAESEEDGLSLHWMAGRVGGSEAHSWMSILAEVRTCGIVKERTCPACGAAARALDGRFGRFVACAACGYKKAEDRAIKAGATVLRTCGRDLDVTMNTSLICYPACPHCNRDFRPAGSFRVGEFIGAR